MILQLCRRSLVNHRRKVLRLEFVYDYTEYSKPFFFFFSFNLSGCGLNFNFLVTLILNAQYLVVEVHLLQYIFMKNNHPGFCCSLAPYIVLLFIRLTEITTLLMVSFGLESVKLDIPFPFSLDI